MPNDHRGHRNPNSAHDPVVLDQAQINRLQSAIDRLRARDRDIFLSACHDRLPYREIASRHRCSVAKVQKIVAKVLVTLDRAVWPSSER